MENDAEAIYRIVLPGVRLTYYLNHVLPLGYCSIENIF